MKEAGKNQLVKQGSLLFISTLVVNLGNYVINLLLGRLMSPADFSEVSLLITLMLMLSFWALAFQLTGAKWAAAYKHDGAPEQLAALVRWLRKLAWSAGLVMAVLLMGLSFFWQDFFQTRSVLPFIIFGAGMPVYLLMSTNRGILQGNQQYGRFAFTYQTEMWIRLGVTLLLVWLGFGVNGVAWGITLSLLASLLASQIKTGAAPAAQFNHQRALRFFLMILVYECSQILLNNSDTVLVKHYFPPTEAGLYAALALMGRIVYFGTWTIVTLLFPMVIKLEKEGKPHTRYFVGGLLAVAAMGATIVAGLYLFPELAVNMLFGSQYLSITPLLWQYALATTLFACANVFVYYHLSLDRNAPAWLMIGGGMLQIVLITLFHASFQQIINRQIMMMSGMLVLMIVYQWVLPRFYSLQLKPAG